MKKVTIKDVAQAAGVSAATVSRAINGGSLVTPETLRTIQRAVAETGYVLPENSPLRSEQGGGLMYLVLKSIAKNSYSWVLNRSMVLTAERYGLRVVAVDVVVDGYENVPDDQIQSHAMEAQRHNASALIISGFADEHMREETRKLLHGLSLPVVFINRSLSTNGFNRILTAGDRGAYLATRHMLQQGRKDLLMVVLSGHDGKVEGFSRAVSECQDVQVHHTVVIAPDDSIEATSAVIRDAFARDPNIDGIFCCADELAAGALRYLSEHGKRVPQDVELIGYNDNLAGLLTPPVSSVRIPMEKICEAAIEMALDKEQNRPETPAKAILLDPQLVLRG